jgi:hypothetical protein
LAKILTDDIETRDLVDPDTEFNFDKYSRAVADIIKGSSPQFSIGIYGDWGTGKTTLMNMIQDKLKPEIAYWSDIVNDSSANEQFREYLKQSFGLNWLCSQEITKTVDGKSIKIIDQVSSNSVMIVRNKEDTKAILKINEMPVYEFIVSGNENLGNLTLRENNILTIWFNAWRYESEEHLALIPLMKVIAYAMGQHPIYKHLRPIILRALFILGKDVLTHFAQQYIMTEKGIEEFEKNITNKLERSAEFEKDVLYFDGMKKIQDEIEKILLRFKNTRIVVFVDDLDRCDPAKALQVFESIKVFLDMKGFIFVLGLSKSALLRLIQIKLNEMGLDNTKAEEYIRKIIQVDLTIKKWTSDAIKRVVNNLLNRLDEDVRMKIKGNNQSDNLELVKDIVDLNPRQAKRLTNNLVISLAANHTLNITAYLVVEYVSKKWNAIYENISDVQFLKFCKKILEESQNERESYIARFTAELENKTKEGIKLTGTEQKIIASAKDFLNPSLWLFMEKYQNIIFSRISSDETETTDAELSTAKDFETAKTARESVAEVNPVEQTKDSRDQEHDYSIKYYLDIVKTCDKVLNNLTDIYQRIKASSSSAEKGPTQSEVVEAVSNARLILEDSFLIYNYKRTPLVDTTTGNNEQPFVMSKFEAIREVMRSLEAADHYDAVSRDFDYLMTKIKDLKAYSTAKLDDVG